MQKAAGKNLSLTQRGSGGQQVDGHALSLQLYSKFIQIVMPIMMKMDDLKQAYWLPSVFHAVLITACEYCLGRH